MNIVTPTKKSGIVASLVILTAIGGGGAFTVSSMMSDEPKEEVKYVASSQKAKVMKDDSVEVPIVESENTAAVEVPEQTKTVEPSLTPVVEHVVEQSGNPHHEGSPINFVYEKRKAAGKFVSASNSPHLWVNEARAAGVPIDTFPQINDVCIGSYNSITLVTAVSDKGFTISNGIKEVTVMGLNSSSCKFIH